MLSRFPADATLLNLPCGAGRFADVLEPLSRRRTVFADASQPMLDAARDAIFARGLGNVELRIQDVTMPAPPERFDVVVCVRLLHHLAGQGELQKALDHLTSVAAKGIVCTFASASSWKGRLRLLGRRLRNKRRGETLRSMADMAASFAKLGWRVEDARSVNPLFSTQTWLLVVPGGLRSSAGGAP